MTKTAEKPYPLDLLIPIIAHTGEYLLPQVSVVANMGQRNALAVAAVVDFVVDVVVTVCC